MHLQHRQRGAVAAVAAAAAVTLILAGCSSSGTDDGGGGEATEEITYWLWDSNQQPAYQQCADAFTDETGIGVTIEQFGWADYWQGLITGFASSTAPDVFADHLSYYPQFVAEGQLLDISDLVAEDKLDLSIYQEGLADLGWFRRADDSDFRRTSTRSRCSTTTRWSLTPASRRKISQRSSGTRPTAAATRSSSRR